MTNSYCTREDLTFVKADIGNYDGKALIQSWVAHSGDLWKSANVGQYVEMVYRDGLELGSAQSSQGAVDSDGEWYYDEGADILWLYTTTSPATVNNIEIGRDVSTYQNEAIKRASDYLRAYINKPIMPRTGTGQADATGDTYEEIINRSTSILAVSYLIRGVDTELADYYEQRVVNTETGQGYADRIKRGEIKLWNEAQERMGEGVVSVITNDSNTTGAIVDTRGYATCSYDNIKVSIATGGTFTAGTSSPVRVDSYVSNSEGLQMQKHTTNATMDGSYIAIGHGLSVRFSPGIYVAGDSWSIEAIGDFVTSGSVKNAQAVRN
tara:strand:+ start:3143 stop:4111 length:969 start_codon:yes stop_codon:yes gene_type:complete